MDSQHAESDIQMQLGDEGDCRAQMQASIVLQEYVDMLGAEGEKLGQ